MDLKFSPELTAFLKDITLVCLVSPTGVGKDTIISKLVESDSDNFHTVKILTSRPRRDWEAGDDCFFIENYEDPFLQSRLQNREVVNLTINPSNNNIYGTIRESFVARKLNLMPTLASSLDDIYKIPFGKIITVSLSCSFKNWQSRVGPRVNSPDFKGRIKEGISSLKLSLEDEGRVWILNDNLSLAAQELSNYLLSGVNPPRANLVRAEGLSLMRELERLV